MTVMLRGSLTAALPFFNHQPAEVSCRHGRWVERRSALRLVTRRADSLECAIPIERRTGIGNGEQDIRLEAAVARAPLIGDLDAAHLAQLQCQEVDPLSGGNLFR